MHRSVEIITNSAFQILAWRHREIYEAIHRSNTGSHLVLGNHDALGTKLVGLQMPNRLYCWHSKEADVATWCALTWPTKECFYSIQHWLCIALLRPRCQ